MSVKKLLPYILLFTIVIIALIAGFYRTASLPGKLKPVSFTRICNVGKRCAQGDCYRFEGEKDAICMSENPCTRCLSRKCIVMESYPASVQCQ